MLNIAIQVDVRCKYQDASVQCDFTEVLTSTPVKGAVSPPDIAETFISEEDSLLHDLESPSYNVDNSQSSVNEPAECGYDTKEKCYLIFESALMLLLSVCKFCGSSATTITKNTVGSLLQVSIYCENCLRSWVWRSQPLFHNVPAGNILTSAAILYSGSLPTKALQLFKILNCPTITSRTFFDHQKFYLQPAIDLVWNFHRDIVVSQLKCKKGGLAFGGDGRADSHSAKYSSYTLLELSCSKIVDFQLVQVILIYHNRGEGIICMYVIIE